MQRLTKQYPSGRITLDAERLKPLAQEAIDAEISASPLLKAVTERLYEYEVKFLLLKKYACYKCGLQGSDKTDYINGDARVCENCGEFFGSTRSKEEIGLAEYTNMIISGEFMLCPNCYNKKMEEK